MVAKVKRSGAISRKRIDALLEALPPKAAAAIVKKLPPRKRLGRPVSVNLAGQVFSAWTVVSRLPSVPGKPAMWICFCECGALGKVAGTNLVRKQSTRCRECAKRAAVKHLKFAKT